MQQFNIEKNDVNCGKLKENMSEMKHETWQSPDPTDVCSNITTADLKSWEWAVSIY